MILKLRQRMAQEESGFTLVELLVVMLILGLLAAIAIPAFFNQRDKAKDADAKASARSAETAMETFATDNQGDYGSATEADLVNIESTLSGTNDAGRLHVTPNTAGDGYTVTVDSDNTPNTFSIQRFGTSDAVAGHPNGSTVLSCTDAGSDGCPASTAATTPDGDWGGG